MENKFENIEDVFILIGSIAGTIFLATQPSSVGVKIGLVFLTFLDVVTTYTVTRSVVRYIKKHKENKKIKQNIELDNEKKEYKIDLEKKLESELVKDFDNKKISYEGENAKELFANYNNFKEKDEPKKYVLKK